MIILAWPASDLSPNARGHWAAKAKAVKSARIAAWYAVNLTKEQIDWDGKIDLDIVFHPPTKRRYDLDNCLAMIKSALDGIADGLSVDDVRFRLRIDMGDVAKGGHVTVTISEPDHANPSRLNHQIIKPINAT